MSQIWDLGTNGIGELASGHVVAGFTTESEARTAAKFIQTRIVDEVECHPLDTQSWHDPDEVSEVRVPTAAGEISFTVKAGPSFGHGNHETTRLILDLLDDNLSTGDRVLDLGTGSGVLAIAASLMNAGTVVAIDTDIAAVSTALANAERNAVTINISDTPVANLVETYEGQFTLIVANVLLVAHRDVAPSVLRLLAPGGRLITSGYLPGQSGELINSYTPLVPIEALKLGPWVGHILGPADS